MTRVGIVACLVTAVVAGGAGYVLHRRLSPRPAPLEVIRQERWLPRSARVNVDDSGAVALSADGRVLVASVREGTNSSLLLQYLDKFEATPIPGVTGMATPFLSHDGSSVGVVAADGSLRILSTASGDVRSQPPAGPRFRGVTFGDGGSLIAGQAEGGLLRQAAPGAWTQLTALARDAAELAHSWPHWIPGSDAVAFTIEYAPPKPSAIGVAKLGSPATHVVVTPGQRATFIDRTHLVVARSDGLWVVELRDDGAAGPESKVTGDVARGKGGLPVFAVGGGHLVYTPPASELALIDAHIDRGTTFRYLVSERKPFSQPRLSPDGQSVAVSEAIDGQRFALAVYDGATGARAGAVEIPSAIPPRWTNDNSWVLFPQLADATWQLSWLSRNPPHSVGTVLTEFRGDGRNGDVRMHTPGISAEWRITTSGGGSCTSVSETAGAASATLERPAADATERLLASGGRWLFFRQGSSLFRREVMAGGRLGSPTVVLGDGLVDGPCGNPNYDVSPDGSRVVAVYRDPITPPSRLRYVLNFAVELH